MKENKGSRINNLCIQALRFGQRWPKSEMHQCARYLFACPKGLSGLIAGLLFAAVVLATGVFAAEENKTAEESKNVKESKNAQESKNVKEPTVVTSQKMTTDQKAKTALFEGNVVTKKGDRTMYADKMLVHYSEEKGGSNIK